MAFTSHCSGACSAAALAAAHADKPLFPVMRKNSSCGLAPINASLFSSRSSVFEGLRSRLSGQRIFPPKKYNLLKTVMTATMPRESANINRTGKTTEKPLPLRSSHLPPEKMEIFDHLQGWAKTNILPYLKPVEKSWQPQDLLPDPSSEGFMDEVRDLRLRSRELPDDYLICLVGDMITEEAIPTYQTMLNTMDGIRDETASSASPWARWIRAWTAEENRHGDLLNKYLYLTGRVDMRKIEQTIQYLIGSGMNPQTDNSAYLGIIYTSFQERATFISHGNTARQARLYGDMTLAQVCGTIAADERRHENAYTKVVEKLFEIDTDYTMLCFEEMMKKKITMPAHLMFDGVDRNIYDLYSLVAQRTGVYTARDYADILEHLIKRWNVGKLQGLSSRGKQAQEYVCRLPEVVRKLEERSRSRVKKGSRTGTVSWIFNREVALV